MSNHVHTLPIKNNEFFQCKRVFILFSGDSASNNMQLPTQILLPPLLIVISKIIHYKQMPNHAVCFTTTLEIKLSFSLHSEEKQVHITLSLSQPCPPLNITIHDRTHVNVTLLELSLTGIKGSLMCQVNRPSKQIKLHPCWNCYIPLSGCQ